MLGFGGDKNEEKKAEKKTPEFETFQDMTLEDGFGMPENSTAPRPQGTQNAAPNDTPAMSVHDKNSPEEASAGDDDFLEFSLEGEGNKQSGLGAPVAPAPKPEATHASESELLDESTEFNLSQFNLPPTGGSSGRGRMGDQMVEMGLISKDQLHVALQQKKLSGDMLGAILVKLGFIAEQDLIVFLAESSGFGVFDPKTSVYDSEALALFDKHVAKKCSALPVSVSGNEYYVAMADPHDVVALDTVRRHLPKGAQVRPLVTTPQVLSDSIDAAYGYASSIGEILKELEEGGQQDDLTMLDEKDAFAHPIVRLVNALVFEAVKMGASDLHFEPEEQFVRVRYRLDGVLFTAQTLHKQHWSGISQRLKIMAQLDIADKISAQDGRFNLNVAGREADFRVSSLPTVHGENIVLRVLDKSASIMPMKALGFSEENRKRIAIAQSKPEGIIIVTGPTGSGKTTSLYSMLNEINDVEVNIQTLEDPVEYSLPMIRQTHVREGVLEFADGIKALLRQDPDIIFVGEIRDHVTAEMALKAAMTGHQVYTSLHTNDSFGALPRLLDLGLKPGMLAGAVVAIFAQRLARRLCNQCKQPHDLTPEEFELLKLDPAAGHKIFRHNPEGCPSCAKGYKGRAALVEILLMDEDMNDMIASSAPISEIKKHAFKHGFKNMADDGILKITEGITDIDAVAKVVDLTKVKKRENAAI
jgi:general secretion pathway protein E/type IV pilus assembly protein PilB